MFLLTIDAVPGTFLAVTAPLEGRVPLYECQVDAVVFPAFNEEQSRRYGGRVHAYRLVDCRCGHRVNAFGR